MIGYYSCYKNSSDLESRVIFGDCCDGDYGDFVMIAVVVASFPLNDEEWGKLGFFPVKFKIWHNKNCSWNLKLGILISRLAIF